MVYKITGTLTNCTSNPIIPYTFTSDLTTITFKANSGYTLDTLKYTNGDGSGADKSSEVKGKTEYKITVGFDNVNFTVTATKDIEPPTKIPYSENLKNCSSNINTDTLDRVPLNIVLTADKGYRFNRSKKIGNFIEYDSLDNVLKNTSILSKDNEDVSILEVETLTINEKTFKVKLEVSSDLIEKIPTIFTLTNCKVDNSNDVVKGDNSLKFTPNNGYKFSRNGTMYYWLDDYKAEESIEVTSEHEINFSYYFTDNTTKVEFILEAERETSIQGSFNNLYKVNNDILSKLSKLRYVEVNGEYANVIDYGMYISNLISIPFNIDIDILEPDKNIILGPKETNVKTDKLLNNILSYEIGKINVPEKFKNNYDYDNVQCILFLPFTDSITIPVEFVINKEISIKYLINGFNGSVSLQIFSNNELCYSNSFEIGNELPFIGYQGKTVIDKNKINIDNGIRKAYIKVIRNIPILTGKGFETLETGLLKDYNGYVECSDISLSINRGTKDELDTIKTLLRNGVVIND